MNKLNYRLLIVEDNPDSLVYFLMSLKELPFINEDIKIIGNPVEAREYLSENEVDILVLDMDLGDEGLNGVKLAKMIPNPPIMIACSAYSEYVFEANEAGIFTYFSKKISFNALKAKMEAAVDMVDKKAERQSRDVLSLHMKSLDDELIEVEVDQIYCAYVDSGVLHILCEKETHKFDVKLRNFQAKLPAANFARPRYNTLVNLAKVDLVRTDELYLKKPRNGCPIGITRSYKDNFKYLYEVYRQNNK
ncbi:LytTR family DNA-binding domain-containing protein [Sphingobacterium sp.]|jgi:DNA-binding LytR/AlgR family response regulator|uniref:LytR/AlgR family response regulator transcription factor n=1 Tax=Sphingobacterium sp. TaxID=341027 RepID=UPI00289E6D2C|nr:LytTR family DNA-binding domain-containing protein [Sphingobacterium sp.]